MENNNREETKIANEKEDKKEIKKDKIIQGVMDGAPAYHIEPAFYIVDGADQEKEYYKEEHSMDGNLESESWVDEQLEEEPLMDGQQISWPSGDKTIEDYYALPDERRVELIDGVFYDMAAPSYIHQNISGMIYHVLMRHVEKNKGSCIPFISPADVQLFGDDKTMVQPDVFVVCNRDRITYARLVNAPDLVIEVISPSTRRKDMDLKLRRYREAGVREYWIIFPEEKQVWVYDFEHVRTESGKEAAPRVYTFADKVPVGIWGGACEVDFAEIDERCEFLRN